MPTVYSRDPRAEASLRHSIRDGVSWSVMIGSGESYFSAFAIFLKATTAQVGILATLPPLIASFAQLLSSWLGRLSGRRKAIIVLGAALQGVTLVPLAVLPVLFPAHAIPILIGCAIVYFAGTNLAVPQWGSLMGDLVPERRRGRFFGHRTRLCSITSFLALVFAGVTLDLFDRNEWTVAGYLTILFVAAAARMVSVWHLSRMYDPPGHTAVLESPFRAGIRERLRGTPFVRFSVFFAVMQFAVHIAAPYFVVYMLRDMQLSYLEFTILSAMSVLVQFLTLNRWGRVSDAFGNRFILVVTGLTIPILPALWLVSTNYVYLLFVQALSGLAWAGFSLSAGNYLYDLIPSAKRATLMAFHNVLANIGIFSGALLGGWLGTHLPAEIMLFGETYGWFSALYGVFLLSTLARFAVAALFLPRLKEMRAVRPASVGGLMFRVSRFHPLSGLNFDIIGTRRRKAARGTAGNDGRGDAADRSGGDGNSAGQS
jgi:MFS family permease